MICSPKFQSTPSVGRATDELAEVQRKLDISIHALRGEGDDAETVGTGYPDNFNPRPPWGGRLHRNHRAYALYYFNPRPPWGGRLLITPFRYDFAVFQSTPSVGRATAFYSPYQPRRRISIHALRGEGDIIVVVGVPPASYFNPRPPWGGRRVGACHKHGQA